MENKTEIAKGYIEGLGGSCNILLIEACITRIRVVIKDVELVQEELLLMLGALRVLKRDKQEIHIVLGIESEVIVEAMHKELKNI